MVAARRILALAAFTAVVLSGCAPSKGAAALDTTQRDVADCILRGGHPRLGPGETIICKEN